MKKLISHFKNKKFMFPKINSIPWFQDFRFYKTNIPGNIRFTLDALLGENYDRAILVAIGYGILGKSHEFYGRGAICCDLKDILPYMKSQ
jgi:hypothetical protein